MKRLVGAAAVFFLAPALGLCQQQGAAPAAKPATDYGAGYDTKGAAPVVVAPAAGPRCPWMNLGTAAGLVGGAVTVNLTSAPNGVVTQCMFTRTSGAGELEIHVAASVTRAVYLATAQSTCPGTSVPLRAIGNEAIECRSPTSAAAAGRVRDQVFTVSVTLPDKELAATNVREAAEQLAGNLF